MTSTIIMKFYDYINSLLKDENLVPHIAKIYTSAVLDPIMPCIIFECDQIRNLSNKLQSIYEVSFFIHIFIKDKSLPEMQNIIDIALDILSPKKIDVIGFEITGMRNINISVVASKDMMTKKLSLSYQALIKEEF
jgi:hypothetical protein